MSRGDENCVRVWMAWSALGTHETMGSQEGHHIVVVVEDPSVYVCVTHCKPVYAVTVTWLQFSLGSFQFVPYSVSEGWREAIGLVAGSQGGVRAVAAPGRQTGAPKSQA